MTKKDVGPEKQIAVRPQAELVSEQILPDEKLDLLRKSYCRDASQVEFEVFVGTCRRVQLDPFSRQIFAIRRAGILKAETSIDGFRVIAERTGKYEGQTEPQWCGEDGVWKDVWLSNKPPSAARIGVHRSGFRQPTYAVAHYDEYFVGNNPIWKKMPRNQLLKCAEALALRKAFPQDLSGIYTVDEMAQAAEIEGPAPLHNDEPRKPAKKQQAEPEQNPAAIEAEFLEALAPKKTCAQVIENICASKTLAQLMDVIPHAAALPKDQKEQAKIAYKEKLMQLNGAAA